MGECESTFDFVRKVSEKYVTQRSHLFSMHKAIKNPCIWVLSSNHRPHCFSNDFSTSSFDQGLLDWKAKFLSLLAWFLHQKASQICCLAGFFPTECCTFSANLRLRLLGCSGGEFLAKNSGESSQIWRENRRTVRPCIGTMDEIFRFFFATPGIPLCFWYRLGAGAEKSSNEII